MVWDALVADHPFGHPFQCWAWGEVKRMMRWETVRLAVFDGGQFRAGAQVLTRHLPGTPLSLLYCPRGPVVAPDDLDALRELAHHLEAQARLKGGMYCKVDPAWPEGTPHMLPTVGFQPSSEAIQVMQSYTLDLSQTEEALLANMRPKTRQYIRKAEREDIEVVRDTEGTYLDACYAIYSQTGCRGGFAVRPSQYYKNLFHAFARHRQYLYVALRHGIPLAFLWLLCAGRQAVELFGGMADAAEVWKGNYTLKWHAIRAMQAAGYQMYDLHGRATEGIDQFKRGFGPADTRWIGAYDRVYHPILSAAWRHGMPVARWLGRHTPSAVRPVA